MCRRPPSARQGKPPRPRIAPQSLLTKKMYSAMNAARSESSLAMALRGGKSALARINLALTKTQALPVGSAGSAAAGAAAAGRAPVSRCLGGRQLRLECQAGASHSSPAPSAVTLATAATCCKLEAALVRAGSAWRAGWGREETATNYVARAKGVASAACRYYAAFSAGQEVAATKRSETHWVGRQKASSRSDRMPKNELAFDRRTATARDLGHTCR